MLTMSFTPKAPPGDLFPQTVIGRKVREDAVLLDAVGPDSKCFAVCVYTTGVWITGTMAGPKVKVEGTERETD